MSVFGVILLIVCAFILVAFLFFLYLGGSKENYLIEVKKLSPAMGILMILTIAVGIILYFDTVIPESTTKEVFAISQDNGVEFYPSFDDEKFYEIYKFYFYDESGTKLSSQVDIKQAEVSYTDAFAPCVMCYTTHMKTRFTGRESVSRHYIFYLPTYMEGSTMNEDNTSNASVVE